MFRVQGIVVDCRVCCGAVDGTGKRVCGSTAAARREQSRGDPVTVTASCCQHYCANCPRITVTSHISRIIAAECGWLSNLG